MTDTQAMALVESYRADSDYDVSHIGAGVQRYTNHAPKGEVIAVALSALHGMIGAAQALIAELEAK